jgi:hypothetical protein
LPDNQFQQPPDLAVKGEKRNECQRGQRYNKRKENLFKDVAVENFHLPTIELSILP